MPIPRIALQRKLVFAALTLVVGALLCCLLLPPLVAFAPAPLPALLLWGAGTMLLAGALLPRLSHRWPRLARLAHYTLFPAGAVLRWLLVGWCVFTP